MFIINELENEYMKDHPEDGDMPYNFNMIGDTPDRE
jgi:hypothetical protein